MKKNRFFYFKLEGGGSVIKDTETFIEVRSAALLRIFAEKCLKMLEVPLNTKHVLTRARGKMQGGFAAIAGITACP